jgi:hypothetical protein
MALLTTRTLTAPGPETHGMPAPDRAPDWVAAGTPAHRRGSAGRSPSVSRPVAARHSGWAPGTRAGRWHPGARVVAPGLRRVARSAGAGLWLGASAANGTRLVYGVRGGRIAWVGAVTVHDGARLSRLRSDVRAAGLR